MNRHLGTIALLLAAAAAAAPGAAPASAQSLDDLNVQVHGFATQAFLYTGTNNWNTTASSDGSAAWTEAVVNLSVKPESRLTIGMQARYFLLGNFGNQIALDWAQADFKVNDRFGIRAGKIKTPFGLYNDSQDIDPAHLWVLLPQSMYPIASRNSDLSEYGGLVYGTLPVGSSFGKLDYRIFAGERVVAGDDGYFQQFRDEGITVPNGISTRTSGGLLRWNTPIRGVDLGVSETSGNGSAPIAYSVYPGTVSIPAYRRTDYFAQYDRGKWMLASEVGRLIIDSTYAFSFQPPTALGTDERLWYLMATRRITGKLSAGAYYSSVIEKQGNYGTGGYQKDWTVATRYDLSPFLYLKFEQHWMNGTLIGFSTSDNTSLQPKTPMTLLKLGVSF